MSSLKSYCPPQTYSRLFRPWDMAQRSAAAHASQAPITPKTGAAAAVTQKKIFDSSYTAMPQNLSVNRNNIPPTNATNKAIKIEYLKVESDPMEAENSDAEDEELEVDDDYLHTSRTSECASSRSNCSHLSDENELYQQEQRISAENILPKGTSPTSAKSSPQPPNINHAYTARSASHRQTLSAHNIHSRAAFEAHQQHPLHLLAAQNMMPTTTASAAASAPPAMSNDFFYATSAAAALSRTCDVATALPPTSIIPASNGAAAASFVGMEAYTFGLMEQEYARIIAEEAHLKAINARKQRPKKFKCPHCDVAFSNNGQLKGHIRIHTGERPFKCDVESCGKTFTRNEELTRHKRIHTGLRPYPCAACGKKFGRRDHLKKHMKTHMPQERQLGPAIFVPMYPYLYGY